MHQNTERRVIAFVNSVANRCTKCLHRNEENCRGCLSLWANSILTDIEADRDGLSKHIDYSIGARTSKIIMILTRAKHALLSRDIDLGGICSFQLKLWTLKKLCKRGILGRRIATSKNGRHTYYYFLKSDKTNQETKHRDEKKNN